MLDELKKLCSVPIAITTIECPNELGVFYWGDNEAPYSGRRIKISNRLSQAQCTAVLAHEIGHALCFEKNCKCFDNSNVVEREAHAHKFALKFLLKHKQKKALKWIVKDIIYRSSHGNYVFEMALKRIAKLKLWQKCLDYVKEN